MLNTPSDSATTMVANISQLARYIKTPAEAAQREASQCWGDLVTPQQLRQLGIISQYLFNLVKVVHDFGVRDSPG